MTTISRFNFTGFNIAYQPTINFVIISQNWKTAHERAYLCAEVKGYSDIVQRSRCDIGEID